MKFLFISTPDQSEYVNRFLRLPALTGHVVKMTSTAQPNVATVEVLCRKYELDAVICSQSLFLRAALEDTIDWIAPSGNTKVTLDDYAGSLLGCRHGRLPVLIINPIDRLFSVATEKHVTNRFLSKLTQPYKWFKQTPFVWKTIQAHEFEATLDRLAEALLIGIDIETIKDPWRSIECVSYTGYYPDTHTTETFVVETDSMEAYGFMQRANTLSPPKVFQNGIYDNTYFLRWNAPCTGWYFDTFHLFHSWLSELPKRLDFIAAYTLRRIRFWKHESSSNKHRYCGMDGWSTVNSLLALLQECPEYALANFLQEFPIVYPCVTIALEGLDADVDKLMVSKAKFEERQNELLSRIRKILGWPDFNPNSPQQMAKVFELLGCQGLGSTDKIATKKAEAAHPFNAVIFELTTEYKENTKLLGTYLDEEKLWDGRLYYSINPGTTVTGRTSSEASAFWYGFQIQNVPTGDEVKSWLLAPPNWLIGEADKAQSEARCVGYLSGDKALLELVESTHDYHSWNAAAFFGIPYEQIYDEGAHKKLDVEIRDLSKRTNHGANYNMTGSVLLDTMGPKKVAQAKQLLKLPVQWTLRRVCDYLLDQYAKTYPGVKGDFYSWIIDTIKATKQLVSPFGWTRYFFGDIDSKPVLNAAVAHPPQNLSAGIVNREWYAVWRETIYGKLRGKVRVKAMIHDSLLFIYKELADAKAVHGMMNTKIKVTDCKGVTRDFVIPAELSVGKTPTRIWSEIK